MLPLVGIQLLHCCCRYRLGYQPHYFDVNTYMSVTWYCAESI